MKVWGLSQAWGTPHRTSWGSHSINSCLARLARGAHPPRAWYPLCSTQHTLISSTPTSQSRSPSSCWFRPHPDCLTLCGAQGFQRLTCPLHRGSQDLTAADPWLASALLIQAWGGARAIGISCLST